MTVKRKVIGSYIPIQVADFFTLFAFYSKTTRAHLMKNLMFSWYEKMSRMYDKNSLVSLITEGYQRKWDAIKSSLYKSQHELRFETFKEEAREELYKGACDDYVEKIIDQLKL